MGQDTESTTRAEDANDIQRADPKARRLAFATLVVLGGAGAMGIVATDAWLARLRAGDSDEARRALLAFVRWGSVGHASVLSGFAVYAWRLGGRVRRDGRFPPIGRAVLRDTRILTGAAAYRRGALAQAAGIGLLAVAVASVVAVFALVARAT